jgi:hypothetical protein
MRTLIAAKSILKFTSIHLFVNTGMFQGSLLLPFGMEGAKKATVLMPSNSISTNRHGLTIFFPNKNMTDTHTFRGIPSLDSQKTAVYITQITTEELGARNRVNLRYPYSG